MAETDLLLVSGSLQQVSANRALLRAAQRCVPAGTHVAWSPELGTIPHFNPDHADAVPEVAAWRAAVAGAGAVLVASPEYAHSLPGTLKNALDWLVGSGELYGKPVGLMSAGTSGGANALDALDRTLNAQGAHVAGRVSVPGVRPKVDDDGEITDSAIVEQKLLCQAASRCSLGSWCWRRWSRIIWR